MADEPWETASGNESPFEMKRSGLVFTDSDSCVSVSPSPDVESKGQTFEFGMPNTSSNNGNLTAALQTEKEFLDFMFSLPRLQTDTQPKDQEQIQISTISKPLPCLEDAPNLPMVVPDKQSPTRIANQLTGNTSRVGLDHLDNLCKMMEQLGDLREQNTRLQKRVHYLEELKTLHDMHRGMDDTIAVRKNTLSLGPVSLSDSDLRLDDLSDFCLFRQDSEDSLDLLSLDVKTKDDDRLLLEPPNSQIHLRRSSSDDERQSGLEKICTSRSCDKEKKGRKSAWGKVKHMITYSKRESLRKKTSSHHRQKGCHLQLTHSKNSNHEPRLIVPTDAIPASDPEEYDIDYEYDPEGTSWEWEGETEAGIWIGPKEGTADASLLEGSHKKPKPHLTITVPSSEDLSLSNASEKQGNITEGKISPASSGSSASKLDQKHCPEAPMTPPSPRRPSNWTKVKQAFLTTYPQHLHQRTTQYLHSQGSTNTPPPTPPKKVDSSFNFERPLIQEESHSGSGPSPEISSDDPLQSPKSPKIIRMIGKNEIISTTGVHKNLADLQRTLTGEFNKKLQEWERLKNIQSGYVGSGSLSHMGCAEISTTGGRIEGHIKDEDLPHEFKKKLHEWEKIKNRDKEKIRVGLIQHQPSSHHHLHLAQTHHSHRHISYQNDIKTKKHEEEDLPPEFKKKLAEWQIRKALVGKNQQNVEEIQKNLGEEFNRKMAEWEKMKALGQAKATAEGELTERGVTSRSSSSNLQGDAGEVDGSEVRRVRSRGRVPVGPRISNTGAMAGSFVPIAGMDRKGSTTKIKKNKSAKLEKTPLSKTESTQKHRDKELQWLQKELNKIDREKQRLEREKEKFLEREARLEKMRHAMRQGPVEKKEIYIKTSTGEFRFEGISQTFTKKLYEWEERRGIRPESSTFILLDPDYQAEVNGNEKQRSPEQKRIVRSRSESSIAERAQPAASTHQSSLSLNEIDQEESEPLQTENKAASEPTLTAEEDINTERCAVLVHMEDIIENSDDPDAPSKISRKTSLQESDKSRRDSMGVPPYAPEEITKLIDSSESEDNIGRRLSHHKELCRSESLKSEEEYRSLLHENMTLLGKLKEQENLCRALENKMGDIDNKMDNVADQHLKTLEKLHRQVTIMRNSESFARRSRTHGSNLVDEEDDGESNQRLIEQLKARIVELEIKGDRLMEDKEQLECAFKLHKEQESEIAESLLMRIRELQEAGAEVNIQTVHCQTEDVQPTEVSLEATDEQKLNKPQKQGAITSKKKRRRRNDKCENGGSDDDDNKEHNDEKEDKIRKRIDKETKDKKRMKKAPPKRVQKLHNLTADLLFQAKRLEQALVAKHNLSSALDNSSIWTKKEETVPTQTRKRSLRGQSSLRLSKDEGGSKQMQRRLAYPDGSTRSWASIEAIISSEEGGQPNSIWERRAAALASESQDLLEMNAELSRMARELRREMTTLWSLRESTSPESNSSEDNREEVIIKKTRLKEKPDARTAEDGIAKDNEDETWLNKEVQNVLENIAALQSDDSHVESPEIKDLTPSSATGDSPIEFSRSPDANNDVFESWIGSHQRFPTPVEEDSTPKVSVIDDPDDEFTTWWKVPLPRKRKKLHRISCPEDPANSVENTEEESNCQDIITEYPDGERNEHSFTNYQSETSLDRDETQRSVSVHLSSNQSLVSIRSASGSNSTSDEQTEDNLKVSKNCSDDGSSTGTLRTTGTSTLRSDVLSSSFEYDDAKVEESSKNSPLDNYFAYPWENQRQGGKFSEKQLQKVGEMIEEASWRLQLEENRRVKSISRDVMRKMNSVDNSHLVSDYFSPKDYPMKTDRREVKFQTEVTPNSIRRVNKNMELKARRVSDTQIHYDESPESEKRWTRPIDTRSLTLDSALSKKVDRQLSIRRNQSESDVHHFRAIPIYHESEQSGNVFVPTHRTIFTFCNDEESDADVENNQINDVVVADTNSNNCEASFSLHINKNDNTVTSSEEIVNVGKSTFNNSASNHLSQTSEVQPWLKEAEKYDYDVLLPSSPLDEPISNVSSGIKCDSIRETDTKGSSAVKSMFELYNKRITEKQELLINPFIPGDPFLNKKTSLPTDKGMGQDMKLLRKQPELNKFSSNVLSKSISASVLPYYLSPVKNVGITSVTSVIDSEYLRSISSRKESWLNPYATATMETSFDMDSSIEDNLINGDQLQSFNERVLTGHSPGVELRATRIKRAKEEFLARGTTLKNLNEPRDFFRNRSNTVSTNDDLTNGSESSFDPVSPDIICDVPLPPAKPPRAIEIRTSNAIRKESFRRQSEGYYNNDGGHSSVVKSFSSGMIEISEQTPHALKDKRKNHPLLPRRASKGILRIFKKKGKEDKELSAVQKLCRQSLVVDIGSDKKRKDAPIIVKSHCASDTLSSDAHGSKTLPRTGHHEEPTTSTRSCPSSPVAPHRSRSVSWLQRGKNMFKGRSPTPTKKIR